VFKDQGKLEDPSTKTQTATFISKPKSANSQQNPSSQSSIGAVDNERELQVSICIYYGFTPG